MGEAGHENGPGPLGADLAALLGATITVLLTLTGSPGAWGPLATIVGLLLLVVLLGFFWGRRPKVEPHFSWQKLSVGFALSTGDCLAGATFQSLCWIGVPAFLLTLAWWYWAYIGKFIDSETKPAEQTAPH